LAHLLEFQEFLSAFFKTNPIWPAPGSEDTELGVFLEWEVGRSPLAITADKAYDSERVRQQIKDEGAVLYWIKL
jgi:hypothetical protein